MYIETSYPRIVDEAAQLISAPFKPVTGSNTCTLRFFYHMFGDHVNELNVWVKISANSLAPMTKVWGKKGKYWSTLRHFSSSEKEFESSNIPILGESQKGSVIEKMLLPEYQSNDIENCLVSFLICPIRFSNLPGFNRPFLPAEI